MLGIIIYLILGYLTSIVAYVVISDKYVWSMDDLDIVIIVVVIGCLWPLFCIMLMLYYSGLAAWYILKLTRLIRLHNWLCKKVTHYYEKIRG